MSVEEDTVDNINDEDMHYDRKDKNYIEQGDRMLKQKWNNYNLSWKYNQRRV